MNPTEFEKIFKDFEETKDKEKLTLDLKNIKSDFSGSFYKESSKCLENYSDFLVLSERDKIEYFLCSDLPKSQIKYILNQKQLLSSKKSEFDSINEFFGNQTVFVKVKTKELIFKSDKIGLVFDLFGFKFNYKNVEKDLEYIKTIGEDDSEVECSLFLEKEEIHLVGLKNDGIPHGLRKSLASFLDVFSKFDISADSLRKGAATAIVASSLMGSAAFAGAKDVNEYINFSKDKLKNGDTYSEMFFENKNLLSLEKQSAIRSVLSQVDFHPKISLISNSFNRKSNSGEFTIDFAGCKTTGHYSDGSNIEFISSPGSENMPCYDLMKGFELILSSKINVILEKGESTVWAKQ